MKKIIAVSGTTNVGKTTSIKMALKDYLLKNPLAIPEKIKEGRVEIIFVVKIDNVITVFASAGDTEEILQNLLDEIRHINWDFLICATKTRGATVKLIETYSQNNPPSSIIWVKKEGSKTLEAEQEAENKNTAIQILNFIK